LKIISSSKPFDIERDKLCELMGSYKKYCTVEAFTMQDYGKLAEYLGISIVPQTTVDRDNQTLQMLNQIKTELADE